MYLLHNIHWVIKLVSLRQNDFVLLSFNDCIRLKMWTLKSEFFNFLEIRSEATEKDAFPIINLVAFPILNT